MGAFLDAATKQAIPPESGGPRTAADGDRQRKREREAERNAERSGGTVARLDPSSGGRAASSLKW